ncbi:MAG: DNA repair protein RecO [Cellulosilyticaceae bacterium]
MIINAKGIIIKEYVVGEGDKYITLFTHELGKIQVGAPKATKNDKGFASGTQLFVYGQFVLSAYKETYKLISVDIISMFHNIREDLLRLSYAAYIVEFLREVTREGVINEELLKLTLRTLHKLSQGKIYPKLIRRIFELRALKTIGLMPSVEHCTSCSKEMIEIPLPRYNFVVAEGGIICDDCLGNEYLISIGYTTLYTIRYILYIPLEHLFQFHLDEAALEQLERVNDSYINYYIDKSFKTIEFIKSIERM